MLMGTMIGIHQQAGTIAAYVTTPPAEIQRRGAVIVVHDIWGLTDHIKDVTERLASAGYCAIAPDFLFMTPEKQRLAEEIQRGLMSKHHEVRNKAMRDFRALLASTQTPQFTSLTLSRLESCFEYVYNLPAVFHKVAAVGFGFGGTYTYMLAVHDSRLGAAVPFYGHASDYLEMELRHITCPILAFYGKDSSQELAVLTPRMAKAGVRFAPVMYEDAGASFFNDTNPATFNRVDAEDAWHRLTAFLHTSLR